MASSAGPAWTVEECLRRIRDVLSIDDDFGQQCGNAGELCSLLADGEKLCCILCVLSDGGIFPDSDPTCFYSENSQILAKRNVKFFLEKCSEHLKVMRDELFDPEDLLESRRPEKVLATLQKLLERPYQVLLIRRKSEVPEAIAEAVGTGVAQNVINEICVTEAELAKKLRNLLRFRMELRGLLSLWSPELVEFTFRHFEELLQAHESLEEQLNRLAEEGTAKFCHGLGRVFGSARAQLAVYGKYFAHYSLAKARLEEEFAARPELREQLHLLERHFGVSSFTVLYDAPLRRVFNYSTMFERLLSTVAKEIPDSAGSVEEALTDCRRLLSHLNECKRSSEKATATQQLLQKMQHLPAELASLQTVGLHRGDGLFSVRRGQEVIRRGRECFCLLTDRRVIVATAPKADGAMKYLFHLPITDQLQLDYLPQEGGGCPAFKIQHDATVTSFTGRRQADLCQWGRLVTQAQEFNFPKGWNSFGHRFCLTTFPTDPATVCCSRCSEPLTGYACQGYHCGHCDMRLDPACFKVAVSAQRPASYPGEVRRAGQPSECRFFHGRLDRKLAEARLSRRESGTFLVRMSGFETGSQKLVVSIVWLGARFFHLIVRQRSGESLGAESSLYSLESGPAAVWHPTLDAMVAHHRTNKLKIEEVVGVSLVNGLPAP